MTSILLRALSRVLFPLLLVFAIYLLLRGHNRPGGGFIAGLIAASAFILWSLSFNVNEAWTKLRINPRTVMGLGLLSAIASGLSGSIKEATFMKGLWGPTLSLPVVGDVGIGTPFFFDVGVFLMVCGVTLLTVLSLHENTQGSSHIRRLD